MMDSSIGAESREATCRQGGSPPVVRCAFCGEPEVLEIADIWTDSNFLLDTCCPALLECVSAEMEGDPAWGRELLRRLGAEELTGHRLRRVSDGAGCHPMLDWQLDLRPVRFATARAFIARHHVHCPPPVVIWTVKTSFNFDKLPVPGSAGRRISTSRGRDVLASVSG